MTIDGNDPAQTAAKLLQTERLGAMMHAVDQFDRAQDQELADFWYEVCALLAIAAELMLLLQEAVQTASHDGPPWPSGLPN